MSEHRSDDDEPFTKTKLFTLGEDGTWTDMGVGIAAVADDVDNDEPILRLDITTIPTPDEPEEVLLSTPVSTDDIYTVQKGSILVWCDPELGRDMAASFHCKEGCAFIVDKIKEYQIEFRRRRERASQNDLSTHAMNGSAVTLNGSGSSLLDDVSNDPLAFSSPWSVCKANLQTILNALFDNRIRIGTHIKDNKDYIHEICTLFSQCSIVVRNAAAIKVEPTEVKVESEIKTEPVEENDNANIAAAKAKAPVVASPQAVDEAKVAMERISKIIMKVLDQHSTDVKILSQIVEDRNIEIIVDIVQFGIGRRTKETGFVTREERHAKFKDPAHLPSDMVGKIHNFFAVQYLRDLVPQALEEGEPGVSLPLVSLLLIRARHTLLNEIMSNGILGNALKRGQSLEHGRNLIGMMLDITTYVKNTSAIGAETKNEVFSKSIELGLMDFIADLFLKELQLPDSQPLSSISLQQAADCLSHLSMWSPIHCCQWLLNNAAAFKGPPKFDPSSPIGRARAVTTTPRTAATNRPLTPNGAATSGAIGTAKGASPLSLAADKKSSVNQSEGSTVPLPDVAPLEAADTLAGASVIPPTPSLTQTNTAPSSQDSSAALVGVGNDFSKCSLLHLLFEALAVVKDTVAVQAIGDAIFNIGIGSLQLSAIVPLFGMEVIVLRRKILQFWVGGPEGSASVACVPMFALMISAGQLSRWAPENSATRPAPPAGEKTKREKDVDEEDDAHIPTSSFTRHLRDLGSHQGPRNRGPNAIRRGPRVSSANEDEITELQCLRVLRLLTKERSISCSSQFADLLRTSRLLSNMSAALHPKTLASGRLCCSAAEFLSELIKTNASRVLQHIISSNVIDGIVRLHESLPRRNTVLTAAILAVFNSAATSVAEAKQRALNNNGGYGSPLGGMGGSPFLSRLAASETSASGNGEGNPNAPDLALVEHILLHYSSYLGYFGVNVLRKLQRIKETGGEGGAGEESSAVTSYSEARALSGTEFQALLVEYGCAPTDGTPGAISVDTGTVLSSVPNFSDEATLPAEPREENDEENAESSDDDTDDAGQLQEQHSPMPRAVPTPHRLSGSKTPRDADIPDQGIASPLDEQTVPPPAQPLPEASASKDESAALPGTTVEHKVLSNKTSPTKLTAETSVRSPDREAVVVDVAAASPPALVRSSSVKLTVSPKQEPANAIAAETTENLQSAHLSKDAQHPDAIVEKVNGAPSPKRLRSESINEKDAHITSSKEGGSETDDTIPQ